MQEGKNVNNITNVDYANNTASIYYRDSIWQSEADSGELTNYAEVSFTITDEGMRFSPFHVVTGKGIFAREQEVYLFLKKIKLKSIGNSLKI